MSFKQLLRGGSPGDPKNRVAPERSSASDGRPPVPGRSANGRSISVLYVGEPRETRLISGAFTYDHPQLTMDVSANLHEASARLAEPGRYDALVVGWTVPESEAAAVISHLRAKESAIAIIAVGEHVEVLREAGADQCVQKGNALLSRLPIAIEEAVKQRSSGAETPAPAPKPAPAPSPNEKSIRVAFAGEVDALKAALGLEPPSLQITPLGQALGDCDVRAQGTPVPFDVIVIDHGAGGGRQTASTLSDVRARSLDVPVVLVLDPREERSAVQTFGAG